MKKKDLIRILDEVQCGDDTEVFFEYVVPNGDCQKVVESTTEPTFAGGSTDDGLAIWITIEGEALAG